MDCEVGKYINDKKYKNKKKTKKSNHKHNYKKYIGHYRSSKSYNLIKVCSICNKVKVLKIFFIEKIDSGGGRMVFSIEKIKKLHPDLEIYELD